MMRVEEPKRRVYTAELERRATEFHGHGGPFMIVGLRMGLAALEALDAGGWFGMRCMVYLRRAPPDSCVIDGVQISTGCTMGKQNIEAEEGNGVSAEFTAGENRVTLTLRDSVLSDIRESLKAGLEATRACMDWLRQAETSEILELS